LWVQSGARGGSAERRAAMRQTVEEVEKILTSVRINLTPLLYGKTTTDKHR
jgi:hypothetical protein